MKKYRQEDFTVYELKNGEKYRIVEYSESIFGIENLFICSYSGFYWFFKNRYKWIRIKKGPFKNIEFTSFKECYDYIENLDIYPIYH